MPRAKKSKKMTPEEISAIAEKNQKYLAELRENKPPVCEELEDIIRYPKEMSVDGLKHLIKYLKDEHDIKISKKDERISKIIGVVFTLGIDEGVKEAMQRLSVRPDVWQVITQGTRKDESKPV
ncbi:MAG: hypothetical protein Q8O88_01055 [bacterium]|nr:hypothetical protein [bacterium]